MGTNVFMRNPLRFTGRLKSRAGLGLLAGCAAALGGCSADVARFDFGHNALNDRTTTASIPTPSEPVRTRSNLLGDDSPVSPSASQPVGQYTDGGAYIPPASNRPAAGVKSDGVKMAALPDVQRPAAPTTSAALEAPRSNVAPAAIETSPGAAAAAADAKAEGEVIEVQPGDTLFRLSKRHQVAVSELMSVNGLKGPNLKPGQKLHLPSNRAALKPLTRTPASAAVAIAAPADLPADWKGSYTVKTGDALYTIARQHKIKLEDLQRYNGITDVRKVKPGMVLHMPGTDGASASVVPPAEAVRDAVATSTPAGTDSSAAPKLLNGAPVTGERVAVALPPAPVVTDASPVANAVLPGSAAVAANGKLRWPVQGKIISGFGQRSDGTHNDGVNLAVPMGTDIHAAEEGSVAYAGSELKGYGNLILVRHDNGWVTAYAHSDELLVKRGDRVKRGQVIAKAGKSGSVDQPQVHFEVRQGQKPVDPAPFMEKI
ncbi:MAG: peptidoglycan DD-metalloendopeptidase family protein [Hyphomicrobium sp.]